MSGFPWFPWFSWFSWFSWFFMISMIFMIFMVFVIFHGFGGFSDTRLNTTKSLMINTSILKAFSVPLSPNTSNTTQLLLKKGQKPVILMISNMSRYHENVTFYTYFDTRLITTKSLMINTSILKAFSVPLSPNTSLTTQILLKKGQKPVILGVSMTPRHR